MKLTNWYPGTTKPMREGVPKAIFYAKPLARGGSMSAHTPGPWINHGRIPQVGIPHSAVASKTLIARVYSESFGDIEEEAANADLIAAAPDMQAALLAVLSVADRNTAEFDQAQAALAKSKGETI